MKTKIIKWLLFLGIIAGISICTYYIIKNPIVQNQKIKYLIKITGAVHYPGEYYVSENSSFLELLQNAKIKDNADLSKLDLNRKISKNELINVEVVKENINNAKLLFNEIKDIKELFQLKVPKIVITKIWNYKQNNSLYLWEEIQQIKGIGDKILIYLKNHITL